MNKILRTDLKWIFLLGGITIFFLPTLSAQEDGERIVIGTYYTLDSKILGEQRTILVHLPQGYEKSEDSLSGISVFD